MEGVSNRRAALPRDGVVGRIVRADERRAAAGRAEHGGRDGEPARRLVEGQRRPAAAGGVRPLPSRRARTVQADQRDGGLLHVRTIEERIAAASVRSEPLKPMRSAKTRTKSTKGAKRPTAASRTAAERALAERMLQRLRGGADLRTRKVRRIRAAIKVRHYENALKLSVAIERMTGAAKRLRS